MGWLGAAGSALLLQAAAAAAGAPVGAARTAAAGAAAPAAVAPVTVRQTSARNLSRVIEQRSSVVSIDRSQTVTQGSTTVTEIVKVGPDPAPVVVSQAGQLNSAVTFQQGREPRLSLQQRGAFNASRTIQSEIP